MNKLTDFSILLSNTCNLRCRYCRFYETNPSQYTRLETTQVLKAVRFFFESGEDDPGMTRVLCFNADGEALTTPELLFEALEYAASLRISGDSVILALVTNATLIGQSEADRLADLGVHVTVSIDGTGWSHDRHRIGPSGDASFQKVVRGIESMKKAGIPLSYRAVISPETSTRIRETYDFLISLEPERPVKLRPVRNPEPPYYPEDWIRQFTHDYSSLVAQLIREDTPVGKLPDDAIYFVRYLTENKLRGDYCPTGTSMLWMLPNGTIIPCGLLSRGYDCGHIDEIKDVQGITALMDSRASRSVADGSPVHRQPCAACRWLPACSGGCPALALEGSPPLCSFYKELGETVERELKEKS